MSMEPLRREVREMLINADDKICSAVKTLTIGSDEQRIHAAGQLVLLRRRKEELEARMEKLEACPDDVAHTVGEWIKEDWMILMHRLETWMGTGQ